MSLKDSFTIAPLSYKLNFLKYMIRESLFADSLLLNYIFSTACAFLVIFQHFSFTNGFNGVLT